MLGVLDITTRLGAAALVGVAIGLDRYVHHKPLVCGPSVLLLRVPRRLCSQPLTQPMAQSTPTP